MRSISRSWPALFAWGAGLLHIALAAQVVRASPVPGAVAMTALLLQGAAELTWGIVSLSRGRPVAPRAVVAGAMTGLVLAAGAIGDGGSPVAVAAVVVLVVPASMLSWSATTRPTVARSRSMPPAVGMIVAAVLVAGLVTPALATTSGGGEHGHSDLSSFDPHAGH
jgi:hypothetical protein